MHPQISELLRRVFYDYNEGDEKLIDDDSTEQLDKPFGFPNHLQFWLHDYKEIEDNKVMRSHINIEEAKICAYMFLLMLCRGYKSSEVTIISLYKGQKHQIEVELLNLIDQYYNNNELSIYDAFDFENDFDDIQQIPTDLNELINLRKSLVGRFVKCLDDFQGEENEVIIISLTRSEKPGFVKNQNRALVTLSRARQMQFVIGNEDIFGPQTPCNKLWRIISNEALKMDEDILHYYGFLSCTCPLHLKERETVLMKSLNHFILGRFSCCELAFLPDKTVIKHQCNCQCNCGHKCHLPCHLHSDIIIKYPKINELLKRRYFCPEKCKKRCPYGHPCKSTCGYCQHYGCPPCTHRCEKLCSYCSKRCSLSCGHYGECKCQTCAMFNDL